MSNYFKSLLLLLLLTGAGLMLQAQVCNVPKFTGPAYMSFPDTAKNGLVSVYIVRKDHKLVQVQHYRNGIKDSVWTLYGAGGRYKPGTAEHAITLEKIKKNLPPAVGYITYVNGVMTEYKTTAGKNQATLTRYVFAPNTDIVLEEDYNPFGNLTHSIKWQEQNLQGYPLTTVYQYDRDSKKQKLKLVYTSHHLYEASVPIYERGSLTYVNYHKDYGEMQYEGSYILYEPDGSKKEAIVSQGKTMYR